LKKRIFTLINKIERKILDDLDSVGFSTLAGGLSGILIFLNNHKMTNSGQDSSDVEDVIFSKIMASVEREEFHFSFYSGISGIAWLVDYLQTKDNLNSDEPLQDYNREIDEYILSFLNQDKWLDEYELMTGVVGLAIYGCARSNFELGRIIAEKAVGHILKLMEIDENGVYWITKSTSRYHSRNNKGDEINLGLAHGMVGVVGVLNLAYKKNILTKSIKPVLLKACHWLLAQRNINDFESYFSYQNQTRSSSRLAWCYGDLSNAYVLYRASTTLKEQSIKEQALEIALSSCSRKMDDSGVIDAGFCHGSSGLMFIYHQLYIHTQEAEFAKAMNYWLEQTIELGEKGPDLKGLERFNGMIGEYDECLGLLEGLAGIGLSLLAVKQDEAPDWADIFLLG